MALTSHDNDDLEVFFVRFLGADEALFRRCCEEARVDDPGPHGLDWPERLAVWIYTSTDECWYERVNKELRDGHPTPDVQTFADILDRALRKLPIHRGDVYRGMTIPDLDYMLEHYEIGQAIMWPAFTSTSKNPARVFDGNVVFILESLNGRELGLYADKPSEEEILFGTGLQVEVLGLELRDGLLVINVAEKTH